MDIDDIVVGLAEINAFCVVAMTQEHSESFYGTIKRWEECINEAIKLLNQKRIAN